MAYDSRHMKEPECVFCRIIARELPAHILDENDQVIVFQSLTNHPMVVTKAHIPDIYALPPDVGAAVMEAAIRVSRAVKLGLQCDGVYLTQANEPAAGQDVFHFHLHIYPCWEDRTLGYLRESVGRLADGDGVTEEEKAATAKAISRHLHDSLR
jgi:histidine triad (HIT) family protein